MIEPTPQPKAFCQIASLHASKDLEQGASPCECEHCQRECDCLEPETTAWFTFGQCHAHQHGKHLLNKDTVVEITSKNPRRKMFELFGNKWSMEYDQPPDMRHFPKGIIKL